MYKAGYFDLYSDKAKELAVKIAYTGDKSSLPQLVWTEVKAQWSNPVIVTTALIASLHGGISAYEALAARTTVWPAASGGRTIINGVEYTTHALERMQPVGTIIQGTEMFSRGVPPSVVENAIKYGTVTPGNTAAEVVRTFENVRVVTNPAGTRVITVMKKSN